MALKTYKTHKACICFILMYTLYKHFYLINWKVTDFVFLFLGEGQH